MGTDHILKECIKMGSVMGEVIREKLILGTYFYTNGDKLQGTWKDDVPDGMSNPLIRK